jgi:hypothetical protein
MPLTPTSIKEITQFVNYAEKRTGQRLLGDYFLTFDEKYVEFLFLAGCVPIMFYKSDQPVGFIAARKLRMVAFCDQKHASENKSVLSIHLQCSSESGSNAALFEHMQHVLKKECSKMYISSFEHVHIVTLDTIAENIDDAYCTKPLYVRPINFQHPSVVAFSKTKLHVGIASKVLGTFSFPIWFDKCFKIRHITPELIDDALVQHISECISEHAENSFYITEENNVYTIRKMLESPIFKNFLLYDESMDETIFTSFLVKTLTNDEGDVLRVGHLYHATFPRSSFMYVDSLLEWVCKWMRDWDCFDLVSIEEMYSPNLSRISKFIPIGASAVYKFENYPLETLLPCQNGMKGL